MRSTACAVAAGQKPVSACEGEGRSWTLEPPGRRSLCPMSPGSVNGVEATLAGLVLRCVDLEGTASFYRELGLDLTPERHGDGPEHYSITLGKTVIELYPTAKANSGQMERLSLMLPRPTESLTDPDGRQVEIISVTD